jgi:hypothetical protein
MFHMAHHRMNSTVAINTGRKATQIFGDLHNATQTLCLRVAGYPRHVYCEKELCTSKWLKQRETCCVCIDDGDLDTSM